MKALQLNTLPLVGTHLIEASAGTGKTFTLAHLYLRLVVERELPVEEILVVTFTRAAVQELRSRLRAIIVEARRELAAPGGHSLVATLLDPFREDEQLAVRLELAQRSMDQAAISTIHTFCTHLLSDNAFDSGQLFDMQVEESDAAMKLQAAQAYWRESFGELSAAEAQRVVDTLGSPEGLLG